MTFEGPWIQGVISRKADPELHLAAFGLVVSLQVTIEAPVIMFLAVGSALARDKQSYAVLWRYTMLVNIIMTGVALLMAFTPLLDLYLGRLLGVPQNIIDATRPAMVIMILWTAFIGYRRFHQGILINHDKTRTIGIGTVIRVVVSAGVAFAFGIWSNLSGSVIGALSLMSAVTTEMFYVMVIMRPDIEQINNTPRPVHKPPLDFARVVRFHLPLALTSLLTLFVRPIIESGLARADNATQALAAFPVIFSILLVLRSGGLAWQEVVIAKGEDREALQTLRQFTWMLGVGTTGILLLLTLTPAMNYYTGVLLNVPENLQGLIAIGTLIAFLIPMFTAFQSYYRARLMLLDTTAPIYQGMGIGFVVTALIIFVSTQMSLPAIPAASVAMTTGVACELLYLFRAFMDERKEKPKRIPAI